MQCSILQMQCREYGYGEPPTLCISYNQQNIEIAYIFKYISYKGNVDGKDPWSIRQTGVYQRYNFATKTSTWIFLHPAKESAFQTRIEQQLASPEDCAHIRENPLLLHNIFISTCFPRWRDFMAYYESRILTLVRHRLPGKGTV